MLLNSGSLLVELMRLLQSFLAPHVELKECQLCVCWSLLSVGLVNAPSLLPAFLHHSILFLSDGRITVAWQVAENRDTAA